MVFIIYLIIIYTPFILFIKVLPTWRNRDKKDALTGSTAPTLLIIKIVLDSMSRILLFSSWLYVTNHGHFSSIQTLIAYYTVFAVLVIFNIVFNDSKDLGRGKYWIGICNATRFFSSKFWCLFIFPGIFLNSLSSILSYNSFDVDQMFGHRKDSSKRHQSTFVKQLVYFIIILTLGIG